MKYSKVTTTDYYGEYDGLNGKDLESGEKIEILFPDGSVEQHTVKTKRGSSSAQIDMNGIPDTFTISKAYIELIIKGAKTKIYLRESKLKVRRI